MTSSAARRVDNDGIEFTAQDFDRARALIRAWAGITLNDSKQTMVFSRLSRCVRNRAQGNFTRYLDRLEQAGEGEERTEFINALTTNLTSFFREGYHFPILAEHLQRSVAETGKAPRIWCSASSTGEEPYSIAITAHEALAPDQFAEAGLLATDIDTGVLAKAAAGVYAAERVAGLTKDQVHAHFHKGTGAQNGLVRAKPHLREFIEFKQLNLLHQGWPIEREFDVIFCRNVMIYFDKPTQATILGRMLEHLRPGGLFFAGHSENFQNFSPRLRACGKTVYRYLPAGAVGTGSAKQGLSA